MSTRRCTLLRAPHGSQWTLRPAAARGPPRRPPVTTALEECHVTVRYQPFRRHTHMANACLNAYPAERIACRVRPKTPRGDDASHTGRRRHSPVATAPRPSSPQRRSRCRNARRAATEQDSGRLSRSLAGTSQTLVGNLCAKASKQMSEVWRPILICSVGASLLRVVPPFRRRVKGAFGIAAVRGGAEGGSRTPCLRGGAQ